MNLSRSAKLPLVWGFTSMLLGMILTLIVAERVEHEYQLIAQNNLVKEAERLAHETSKRLNLYEYGLRGARGFVLGTADQLSRKNFRLYTLTRDYQREFSGAKGFGFIRRVPVSNEKLFLQQARADDQPDFTIQQLTPHQNERYVIQYIEPQAPNQLAIGLDINSEKFRRDAAETAITTGQVQITAPITLVQNHNESQQSFLILLAVYSSWTVPLDENERWQQAIGWVFAPLSMQDILDTLNVDDNFYQLKLTDTGDLQNPVNFYNSEQNKSRVSLHTLHTHSVTRMIYGRTWQFDITAKPALLYALSPIKIRDLYTVGGLISFLLGLLATILGSNRQAKQKIAAQQSALASIVESTHDGIIGKTLDGTITSWNKGAEEIFGYSSTETIGKKLLDLIVPENLLHEEKDILFKINNGEEIKQFVTTRMTKSGKAIDVLVNVSPVFNKDGEVVSASKTVRDITEIKTAERQIMELNSTLEIRVDERTKELEEARRNLQTLLDAVPSVISYWDSNFSNQFANHAHLHRFGYSVDDIKRMTFANVIGDEMLTWLLPYLELAFGGSPQKMEYSIINHNREHHFLIQLLPDIKDNKVQGFYFIEHDITEQIEGREKLANTLREQQALHNTVNAQFLYSVTNPNGKILEINDQFCQATGYSSQELIGQDHRIINSGVHPREFWQKMWISVKQGITWRAEVCNKTKQGELRWFDSVIAPMLDANGKVEKLIALRSDITERKRTEEHRNRLNQLIENILSAATEVSIIATDLEGNISLFNRGAERMLGYKATEIVGKVTPAIIHLPEEISTRSQELSQEYGIAIEGFNVFTHKAKSGQPETRRWTYVNKEGMLIQVSLTVTGMFDDTGHLFGYLGIAVDITDQDKLENELRTEKENADAANTAKSQFLANMSHEIRTPMNAVLGMLQLVQQTPLTENQQDYVDKAKSAAQSLLGILNDILDFSKIEAGKLLLDPHPFSIEEMLEDLAVIMSVNRQNKPVELLFDLPSDLPARVVADRLRLQQILVNLTGNALKFTENGYVKVSIKRLQQTATDLSICIGVIDTGIGISPEHQQKIFAGFTQAEASTTRRFGGTGLGLAICKRLTDMMGSTLFMKSEPGKGSHFWFDLTLPITNSQAESDTKSKKKIDIISNLILKNMDILVVEDNEVNRQVACELLTHAGAQIDLAAGGIEGVMKVMQKMENNSTLYDLVIMDIQMPDIDGFEATRRIRADKRFKDLPILAMTANASETDRQACLSAGMNDHTAKPFDLNKLIPLIFQLTGRTPDSILPDEKQKPIDSTELLEDLDSLLKRYAGNFDLFKQFQKKFKPDVEKLLTALKKSVDDNNSEAAIYALHSLKGLSATLGAPALSRYASELEKNAKQQLIPHPIEIEKLNQLLIDTHIAMEKMANPEQQVMSVEQKQALPVESGLANQLTTLAGYLKTSNMDAVHLMEKIQDQLPDGSAKTEMMNHIHNLEFAKAHSSLYKIIEGL